MPDTDQLIEKLKHLPRGLVKFLDKWLRKLPAVKVKIDSQTESIINSLEPYGGTY